MTDGECIAEMFHCACTSTCDDWNRESLMKSCQSLIGKAFLLTVMVHRCEKDLACATFLCLKSPVEQVVFGWDASSIEVAAPCPVILKTCIYCHSTFLAT